MHSIYLNKPSGGGNGNPLQYCCLKNPMDRGAWRAAVHGVAQSRTRLKRLSTNKPSEKATYYMIPTKWYFGKAEAMETVKYWCLPGVRGERVMNRWITSNFFRKVISLCMKS